MSEVEVDKLRVLVRVSSDAEVGKWTFPKRCASQRRCGSRKNDSFAKVVKLRGCGRRAGPGGVAKGPANCSAVVLLSARRDRCHCRSFDVRKRSADYVARF